MELPKSTPMLRTMLQGSQAENCVITDGLKFSYLGSIPAVVFNAGGFQES